MQTIQSVLFFLIQEKHQLYPLFIFNLTIKSWVSPKIISLHEKARILLHIFVSRIIMFQPLGKVSKLFSSGCCNIAWSIFLCVCNLFTENELAALAGRVFASWWGERFARSCACLPLIVFKGRKIVKIMPRKALVLYPSYLVCPRGFFSLSLSLFFSTPEWIAQHTVYCCGRHGTQSIWKLSSRVEISILFAEVCGRNAPFWCLNVTQCFVWYWSLVSLWTPFLLSVREGGI